MRHALIILLFQALLFPGIGMAQLPLPIDLPQPPLGAEGVDLGGTGLPSMSGTPLPGSPAVSMVSETILPDETLMITGDGLSSSIVRIWAEGTLRDVTPLRTYDNRMQIVVPPDMPESTMLLWPVDNDFIGTAVRINGSTLWWSWPSRLTVEDTETPQQVTLMGKNFTFKNSQPHVWISGPGLAQWLTVVSANPYQVRALLPTHMQAGTYNLWVHNGSGGDYGWSETIDFEIVSGPQVANLLQFSVNAYGAAADDGIDDWDAITAAINGAVASNGGIVVFGQGNYHVRLPLTIPSGAENGIHFAGLGKGNYDDQGTNDIINHSLSGSYSAIYPLNGSSLEDIISIESSHSSIRNMTLVNYHDGSSKYGFQYRQPVEQTVVRCHANDVEMSDVRFVLGDARPGVAQEQRDELVIYDSAVFLESPGMSNIDILSCEILTAGGGIQIGYPQYAHSENLQCDPSTNNVKITDSDIICYSVGLYKEVQSGNLHYDHAAGIALYNTKNVLIEANRFSGADRIGRRMLDRSILMRNTSIRNVFVIDNICSDVGFIQPPGTPAINMGEQVLFHYRYPHGGYFDVVNSTADSITLDTDDPRNGGDPDTMGRYFDRTASRIPSEVGENDHWLIYVAAGKGAGQYRVVDSKSTDLNGDVILSVNNPWRVTPDLSSSILLFVAYRQNVVYKNTIDAGFIDENSKVGGTQFWLDAVNNIVDRNVYKNMSYGVVLNSSFRNPCIWNLTQNNVMHNIDGFTGAGTLMPTGYNDSYYVDGLTSNPLTQASSDCQGWYTVGNTCRSNVVENSKAGALVQAHVGDYFARTSLLPQTDAGLMSHIVENNTFKEVEVGVKYNAADSWFLIRNNFFKPYNMNSTSYLDQSFGNTETELIVEDFHCGQPGMLYLQGDINKDCYVDLSDFAVIPDFESIALLALDWLSCTNPVDDGCDYWQINVLF